MKIFENMKIGTNILLESENFGKTTEKYIGWYPGHFFITTLKPIPGINNIFTRLSSGVEVKFFIDGKIYIGKTSILHYTFKPTGLLFLKKPTTVETILVRRAKRVTCSFPGGVAHQNDKNFFPGLIIDLSEGGAGFVFENPWHKEQFIVGEKVNLKLIPVFNENELIIPAFIRSFFEKDGKSGMGLAFAEDAKEEEIEFVKNFVTKVCAPST